MEDTHVVLDNVEIPNLNKKSCILWLL